MALVDDMRVVIIDDDEAVCEGFSALLETHGHRPETYTSGLSLIEQPISQVPMCLIIDYRLPDMDGLQVHSHLLKKGYRTHTTLICSIIDDVLSDVARACGIARILQKPVGRDEILAAVRHANQEFGNCPA